MARIPAEELERIKGEIGLVRVVEASGVELNGTAKTWWAAARSTTTRAEPGDHARQEPLALPGGVPGGRGR